MLKIYLTNLGLYNEGILSGEWLTLPATEEEIQGVYNRTGYDEEHEEYFITDYESDVNGLEIGEYDNIDDLNELAELIDDEDPEKIEALIYFGYDTPDEIRDHLDDISYITTPSGAESEEEAIGYYYAEECGGLDIPDNIKSYFDYEAYGRDIMLEGQFYTASNGDIYEFIA